VQIDGSGFDERFVAFRGVLSSGIAEESVAEGTANGIGVAATGYDGVFIPLHDFGQLISDIFRSAHSSRLDEILETPGIRKFVLFPGIVYI